MPIRFRCYFCAQLLAIAHRKAGTVITCPTCRGQVWVPDPSRPEETQPPAAPLNPEEFDVELVPLPSAASTPAPTQSLLYLTPRLKRLLLLALLVILLLLFGAGVWFGRSLRS